MRANKVIVEQAKKEQILAEHQLILAKKVN